MGASAFATVLDEAAGAADEPAAGGAAAGEAAGGAEPGVADPPQAAQRTASAATRAATYRCNDFAPFCRCAAVRRTSGDGRGFGSNGQ